MDQVVKYVNINLHDWLCGLWGIMGKLEAVILGSAMDCRFIVDSVETYGHWLCCVLHK